jgi:hypothetical protein
MRAPHIRTLALSALLLAAACDDITTSTPEARVPQPTPNQVLLGTVTCHVDVASETQRCAPTAPFSSRGGPSYLNRFILDSAYWTLETPIQYNSGGLAYFYNEIQNDLGQDIGVEGLVNDSIFAFITNITTTGGSGTVTPNNHDGTRGFTAPSQAYWVYAGAIGPGDDTSMKTWTFNLPATVTSWSYTIGVQTTVRHPTGWVEISGTTRIPLSGSTQFTAVVRDWTGTVDTGGSVTWSIVPGGSGSVSTTVNNSRQATFTGTSVGFVGVTASHGSANPHTRTIEVY